MVYFVTGRDRALDYCLDFRLANTLNLILGGIAAVSLGVQVWQSFSGDRKKKVSVQV